MIKNYVFTHEYIANLNSPNYKLGVLFAKNYEKQKIIKKSNIMFIKDKIYIDNELAGQMKNIDQTSFGFLANNEKVIACYYLNNTSVLGSGAGGRFVIYEGCTAEYTIYGSGRPIKQSYFGNLHKCNLRHGQN